MHRALTIITASLFAVGTCNAGDLHCSDHAIDQAGKLLSFHSDDHDRVYINPEVKKLPPLRNPANPAQRFRVLEVWGSIYRADYRMRLLYADIDGECLLMGQEVLSHASL